MLKVCQGDKQMCRGSAADLPLRLLLANKSQQEFIVLVLGSHIVYAWDAVALTGAFVQPGIRLTAVSLA